ncbi:MAG TPA: glycosyltransferase family 39 protein [Dehalococcoidia bacterium]|nr:glycosyltransferase family 39 protein [Dehalococcoidia bacterium]
MATDEGIFAAVAERVLHGGTLYADAWESKPPLFIYIYVGLIKLFGAGVLPLRIAAAVSAIGSELALYGVARTMMGRKAALWATAALALLIGVPFWEGNLALADTFTLLPSTLGVLCALRSASNNGARSPYEYLRVSGSASGSRLAPLGRREYSTLLLVLAGSMFGLAFLIRQTAAVVALGVVLWWLLSGREWLRPAVTMALGSALVVLPVVAGFAVFGSFHWFLNANIGFFFRYIPSGEQIPIYERPLIVLPALVTIGALFLHRRRGETPRWGLPALWLTLTLAAAMLTGRPYPHYFLNVFPPLALLIVMIAPRLRLSWRPERSATAALAIAASVALRRRQGAAEPRSVQPASAGSGASPDLQSQARWALPALWLTLTLATAMLTGRPYPHYFLIVFPPLALLVVILASQASLAWRPRRLDAPALAIAASIALLWVAVVAPEFGNPYAFRYSKVENYYPNFAAWAAGAKSDDAYERYFDERVPMTEKLGATLKRLGAGNQEVYIWGETPWSYALSGSMPATAYTTSFYVLLIPDLDTELWNTLLAADPRFIVMLNDAWPRYHDDTGVMQTRYQRSVHALNSLIAMRYEQVAVVGRAHIFQRTADRPLVDQKSAEVGPK